MSQKQTFEVSEPDFGGEESNDNVAVIYHYPCPGVCPFDQEKGED